MSDTDGMSLRRVSTAEAVADTLIGLIVSGTLEAGEPLRESALAARFGISRSSLREAIRLLEQSRLVKHEIHRGAVVTTPTLADLEDLTRARMPLELAAVRQVPTEQQMQRLHEAFETLTKTSDRNVAETIVAADLALHQAIVDMIGSERVSAFYREIGRELLFYFTVLSYTDQEYVDPHESIVSRHRDIYEAICAGDRELAAELLSRHIEDNHARLREILAPGEAPASDQA